MFSPNSDFASDLVPSTGQLPRRRVGCALLSLCGLLGGCSGTSYLAQKDLAYVSGGGVRQQGDLYLPEGKGPHPAAVVIHGGGWVGRDRSDMIDVAELLAARGYAAFNVNYRLAPEHHFPAQLDDIHAALSYLRDQSAEHRLDPDRIITVGYSSGGHLALLAAGLPDPDGPAVRGVLAGGAPTDLLLYPESPYILKLIGEAPEQAREQWTRASPLTHAKANHPPVYLYHAYWDRIVDPRHAQLMEASLEASGVPVRYEKRYLLGHLLLGIWQEPSIRRGIDFLESRMPLAPCK